MSGVQGQRPVQIVTDSGDSAMDDTNNAVRVNLVTGGGAGGTSSTDEATYTPTTSMGTPAMGAVDEVAADSAAEGTLAIIRATTARALHVNLRDAAGSELSVGGGTQYTEDAAAAANPVGNAQILVRADTPGALVTTDGDNVARRGTNFGAAFTQIVTSAGAFVDSFSGGTQYTEDAAAAADPVGTALIMVRDDSLSAQTSTDGDNIAARGTDKGELYVKHVDAIPVTDNSSSLTVDNAALSVTGGGTEATALRVTVATDSTGVLSVDDNGSTLSVDDGSGSLTVDNTVLSVVGGGTEATAQRVTIASDSTGVLSVDDNGSTLSVDDGAGSLTVDNAALSVVGGGTEATAQRVTIASDSTGVLSVDDNGGSLTVDGTLTVTQSTASSLNAQVVGDVAHSATDSGNPVKMGAKAIEYGSNPTEVDAGERTDLYATRGGIPFHIGGHPNAITRSFVFADADNAQTDTSLLTVAAGTRIVITKLSVFVDSATTNSGGVAVRIGFGTANVPTPSSSGVNGLLFNHPGIAAGSGVVEGNGAGILGIGASNEDLRITSEDPTAGSITVTFTYYTASA